MDKEAARTKNEQKLVESLNENRSGTRMKFDPTINLSTLIGAGSLLVSGALAYSTLDKRISVVEEQMRSTVSVAAERASDTKESLREIKAELKDLARGLEKEKR